LIENIEDFRDPPNPAIPTDNTRTTYGYDGINQTSVTDHDGNTTSYEYDDALRLKKITYPAPGGVIEYAYDAAGNLFSRKDQRNIWTYYEFDDLHHLTHRYYPTRTEDFTFDRSNRLRQARNGVVDATFAYDEAGRIDTAAQQLLVDPATYTLGYDYVVAADDVRRITHYPAGQDVTHQLDKRFRLASVAGGSGVGATWTHDLANRRKDATLGNGLFTSFEYDLNDRLTKIKHARDASTLFDIDYGYDEVGNRLWTRYSAASDNNNLTDRSETYAYDNRDRLVSMSRGTMAGGSPVIQTPIDHNVLPSGQQWTNLDRRGNWREFSELFGSSPTGVTQARSVNAVNQYTAISLNGQSVTPALQHDAAGNLTLDPLAWNFWAGPSGLKYEYDEENRLTRVRIAVNDSVLMEIGYDAIGRRVETVEYWDAQTGPLDSPRHTRHVYDGLQAVEEYECGPSAPACGSGWSLAREFVWGGRFPEPIAMVDYTAAGLLPANQPEVLHYLHNVLGSVIGLTNSAGTLVERYTYDPYGRTLVERRDPLTGTFELNGADGNFPTWSSFGNPFMWTAQRYDALPGTYHFWARTYSPFWGRWHQQDPLGYTDSANLYEYVAGSPLNWLDPLGLEIVFGGDKNFNDKCKKQIDELKEKDPRAKHMIEDLEKSKHKHVIRPRFPGRGNETRYKDTEKSQKPGEGSDTEIGYDPNASGQDEDKKHVIPPPVRLIHELGHANDADKGTRQPPDAKNDHGVKKNEESAVGAENWVRSKYGLNQRDTYEGRPVSPREPPLSKPPTTQPKPPSSQPGSQPASGPTRP